MKSLNSSLKIHEICRVAPQSTAELSLPLTFFDLLWFKLHPCERLFFYSLPQLSEPSFFFDTIIPKLKRLLSQTLKHFLPLAGNIVWPSHSRKPVIQYVAGNSVSFIVAESNADFNHLSSNSPRKSMEFRPFIPHLETSVSSASILAIQVTIFQNKGFCIGITTHHAALDGKSSTIFMKAWAYLCKNSEESSLLPELEPSFDRSIIEDSNGLDIMYLKEWNLIEAAIRGNITNSCNARSLEILSNTSVECLDQLVLATFELNRADLEKIKKKILSMWDNVEGELETTTSTKPLNLSTFILTSAFVFTCIGKAIKGSGNRNPNFSFGFSADCRARIQPPVDGKYIGNCVFPFMINTEPKNFITEDGIVIVARKIYNVIQKMEKGVLNEADSLFSKWKSMASEGTRGIGIGGSTRFGVYGVDFGWGRPVKVEITTANINGLITMAESRDGYGGVEVGLLLYEREMGLFDSFFCAGLEDL